MSNIKSLRLQRRMSQIAVQLATGIDQSLLSKYERGERLPSTSDLLVLADFFGTSVDFLLERTDAQAPYPRKTR